MSARAESLHVAVLCGGASSERAVSQESGRAVAHALGQRPREVARVALVEWREDGDFELEGVRLPPGAALEELSRFDAVLLALHGGAGEDGTLQGWLEVGRVRYSGSGPGPSALCMDKHATRELARASGVRVARGAAVARGDDVGRGLAELLTAEAAAYFVKDRFGGSSIGTTRVDGVDGLVLAVEAALETVPALVVEAGVPGVEVSCSVLDGPDGPSTWPVVEIEPASGRFFDYEQKYDAGGAVEHCPPRSIDGAAQERVQAAAVRTYRALGCAGVARVDFVVGVDGEPVLLEVNSLPGMTPRSLVPLTAEAAGIDYPDLCVLLARRAHQRAGATGRRG